MEKLFPVRFCRERISGGFTLLELVIFTGIFVTTIMAFIAVLVTITRSQVRQSSVAEVNQQSQYILQSVQYYVERSSLIESPADIPTTTIRLRMPNSIEDPTLIFSSGTAVYAQVGAGQAQPLTSNKVLVSNFFLTKRSNSPGKDSLAVNFTLSYNTSNIQQQFTQALEYAATRVNAATFDAGVFPQTAGNLKLGTASQNWQSINDTIYFNGSNVGIGVASPNQAFVVNGGLQISPQAIGSLPSCNASTRGTMWYIASSTKDTFQVCAWNGASYIWAALY